MVESGCGILSSPRLGLGKIPQVDYTPTEPAGETPASSSRTPVSAWACHELQVQFSLQNAFHRFLYLAVEPSFQPRDGKPICYEYQGCSVCNVYERCSGKPICCLSRGQVFFDLFSGVLPDSLILSVCFFFFFILCIVLSVCIWSGHVLPLLFGHVLLPLRGGSGHVSLGLCGDILWWLGFFSGNVL